MYYNNINKSEKQYSRSDNMNSNTNNSNTNNSNTEVTNPMNNSNNTTIDNESSSNGNTGQAQENMSFVKILHASPGAPAVDIYIDDKISVEDLAFSEATEYLPLLAGTYNIKVYAAGTTDNPVINTNVELPGGTRLTVAAIGNLDDIRLLPIPEDIKPSTMQGAFIRVAHLSPDAPAVDVTLPNGTVVFQDVEFGEVTDYVNIPRGVYTLQIRPTGSSTVVMTISNVEIMPNFYYTFYVLGQLEGDPSLQVLATVNRTPGILTTNFNEELYPLNYEITTPTTTAMNRSPKNMSKAMDDFCDKYDEIYADLEKHGLDRRIAKYLVSLILDYVNNNHNRYKGTIRRKANMAGRDLTLLYPWIFDIMSALEIPNKKIVDITIIIVSFGFDNI